MNKEIGGKKIEELEINKMLSADNNKNILTLLIVSIKILYSQSLNHMKNELCQISRAVGPRFEFSTSYTMQVRCFRSNFRMERFSRSRKRYFGELR